MTKLQEYAAQLKEAVEKMTPEDWELVINEFDDGDFQIFVKDERFDMGFGISVDLPEYEREKYEAIARANLAGIVALRNLVPPLLEEIGPLAQSVEQRTHNSLDGGSTPSRPTISLVVHDSPESVFAAYAQVDSTDEISEIGGVDGEGKDIQVSMADVLDGMRHSGLWGFADVKKSIVHIWKTAGVPREDLLFFFGHEVGHIAEEQPLDANHPAPEEERADSYGWVALEAMRLLEEICKPPEITSSGSDKLNVGRGQHDNARIPAGDMSLAGPTDTNSLPDSSPSSASAPSGEIEKSLEYFVTVARDLEQRGIAPDRTISVGFWEDGEILGKHIKNCEFHATIALEAQDFYRLRSFVERNGLKRV